MKSFIIKQLNTFEYFYEVEGENEEDALFRLLTEDHDTILGEFHSMNDRSDWEISENTGVVPFYGTEG